MQWRIKHIFNFPPEKPWARGCVNFGFHGRSGAQYFLHYNEHWLGRLTAEDEWLWTAGAVDKGLSRVHIPFSIQHPHYITELPDNSLLVSSNGTNQIFRLRPAEQAVELFADTGRLGSLDLVELNPALDVRSGTAALVVDLIESLFGKTTLMRKPLS